MSGHTLGPWEADAAIDEQQHRYYQIDSVSVPTPVSGLPLTIADTSNRDPEIDTDEDRANALLIAAAPELAEALEGLLEALSTFPIFNVPGTEQWARRSRAALAKARGGAA
jgi:hypothetical protein